MQGCEYLSAEALAGWWSDLDTLVRAEIAQHAGGAQAYLSALNPQWRLVGRVTFHLAENKRDPDIPLPSWRPISPGCRPRDACSMNRWARRCSSMPGPRTRLLCSRFWFPSSVRPSAAPSSRRWSSRTRSIIPWPGRQREAYRFLQDIPVFEESGLVVRVPDWWKANRPPRPVVNVKIDSRKGSGLSASSLLDFSVNVTLDGEPLTASEMEQLLQSVGGLVALKGKWVEIDREKLAEALNHWKKVEARDPQERAVVLRGHAAAFRNCQGTGSGVIVRSGPRLGGPRPPERPSRRRCASFARPSRSAAMAPHLTCGPSCDPISRPV